MAMRLLSACGLFFATGAKQLTQETWATETSSKRVFVNFCAPSSGHCKRLGPDWHELMKDYADSSVVGVYDVDCTMKGKELCRQAGVRGYPTILYGDPSNITALGTYNGAKTLDALSTFAKATLVDGQPVAPPAPPPKPTGKPVANITAKPMAKPGKPKPNAGKGVKSAPGKIWSNKGRGKVPTPAPRPHRKDPARRAMGAHDPAVVAERQAAARRQAAASASKMGAALAGAGKMGPMGKGAAYPPAGAGAGSVHQRRAAAQRRHAEQKQLHAKQHADTRRKNAQAAARRQAAAQKRREL